MLRKERSPDGTKQSRAYTRGEEIANSVSHGIGTALSVAGLAILVVLASLYGDVWQIVSFSIYGASLVLLYLASTLYHSFQNHRIKRIFKVFDHISIYLLIAGTYTPFLLVNMRGPWGWTMFGIIWGLAIAGIVFKILFIHRFRMLSLLIYILMGWLCMITIKQMVESIPTAGLIWLGAGGLFYTLGVLFYVWKKLLYGHFIWHLFVLGGSICHFFAILFYVLLAA